MANHAKLAPVALLLALGAFVALAQASIDNKPVRVTHRNSGPEYSIEPSPDNVARPDEPRWPSPPSPPAAAPDAKPPKAADASPADESNGDATPIGHISIRRIFLVPIGPPSGGSSMGNQDDEPLSSSSSASSGPVSPFSAPSQDGDERAPLRRLLWSPFRGQPDSAGPLDWNPRGHLLGTDEASRPPPSGEREEAPRAPGTEVDAPRRADMDPYQLMLKMVQHALMQQLNAAMPDINKVLGESLNNNKTTDENKPIDVASAASSNEASADKRPPENKESKEDIVEIDGKKFLRKVVINRHVGDNIIFMTKRLIFVPLNETSEAEASTSTTPAAPATSSEASQSSSVERAAISTEPTQQPSSSTTTSTTSTSTTEAPTSSTGSEQPAPSTPEPKAPEPIRARRFAEETWTDKVANSAKELEAKAGEAWKSASDQAKALFESASNSKPSAPSSI